MENSTEFKRFTYILHLLANTMERYSGDIFLDFPKAWEEYNDPIKDYPIFLVRKTGCDLINRYEDILKKENKPHELADCLAMCNKSLGWDYAVEITPYKVIITNNKLSKWQINDLLIRLNDRKDIGEVEVVENGKEKGVDFVEETA